LAYSADGSLLASGGTDHTVVLWDVFGERSVARTSARLSGEEGDRLWTDLADAEAGRAYRALRTLLEHGKGAATFLKARLQPVARIEGPWIARRIADLDNNQFAVREKAARDLEKRSDSIEGTLRKVLEGRPSLEVRRRIEALVKTQSPQRLRSLRAVEVLEHLGVPEAQALLRLLARGAPEARLTQEAKASLTRLATRPAAKP
jgi:hypothetical protein